LHHMDFLQLAALGAQPTPSAVAPVIVRVLEQRGSASKGDLLLAVSQEWESAGGEPVPEALANSRMKKALAMLLEQGITENPVHGYYRLRGSADGIAAALPPLALAYEGTGAAEEVAQLEAELEDSSDPEMELGDGSQALYAFYLPTYRRAAEMQGHDRWPIKVGMTTTSVAVRMAAHRTALPEAPELALVVRSENSALLEKVVHGVLTLRGLRSDESGGSEWFITNPRELAAIYRWVVPVGA
jgi:hypothetical protein